MIASPAGISTGVQLAGLTSPAVPNDPPPLLTSLPAPGPDASVAAEDLYGWLQGNWDVVVMDHDADGTIHQRTGEWHFGWVLQGRALQDVWISPRRGERPLPGQPPGPRNRYGTTIRFFDPAIRAWRVTWIHPVTNYVATLVGRAAGGDIVQEGTGGPGELLRWTFHDITPSSFRWRGDVSTDGGSTWRTVQEMSARRAPAPATSPTDPAARLIDALLAAGPAPDLPEAGALFGQFAGSWDGTMSGRNPDGGWTTVPGELHFGWVLEGRAVQDVWVFPKRGSGIAPSTADEYGSTIRFYDREAGDWRIVWISPMHHVVRIFRARADGDEMFIEGTNAQGQPQRWIFSDVTPTSFRWRNIVSADGGRTWQVVERVEARRMMSRPPEAAR